MEEIDIKEIEWKKSSDDQNEEENVDNQPGPRFVFKLVNN